MNIARLGLEDAKRKSDKVLGWTRIAPMVVMRIRPVRAAQRCLIPPVDPAAIPVEAVSDGLAASSSPILASSIVFPTIAEFVRTSQN